jgi:putative hydrolase of the HAD superfamily
MRPTLIIDADDTLWNTEIYYHGSIQAFIGLMTEAGFEAREAREMLDAVQLERVPVAGYSPHVYVDNLVITYQRLCAVHGVAPDEAVALACRETGRSVLDQPVEPIDGVEATLEWLASRSRLLVLTKGDYRIQESKLRRSGLHSLFEALHVVHEKDATVLRRLVEKHGLEPDRTWMVGNSPRSDINPAIEAGIGAIYIPHELTWDMEDEPIREPERVIELRAFSELRDWFMSIGSEAR